MGLGLGPDRIRIGGHHRIPRLQDDLSNVVWRHRRSIRLAAVIGMVVGVVESTLDVEAMNDDDQQRRNDNDLHRNNYRLSSVLSDKYRKSLSVRIRQSCLHHVSLPWMQERSRDQLAA
jgi:hypothetical protein